MVKGNKISISAIILVGNEKSLIYDAVKSCLFADETILVAANSNSEVINQALKANPNLQIIETKDEYNRNFSKWRNLGLKQSKGNWILYIDTDERVTPNLQQEIIKTTQNSSPKFGCYVIPRANHYLGARVHYGGSYPDYVKRLFPRTNFFGYKGDLHEEPIYKGEIGYLKNDLLHYTHRDLTSMLQKTIVWTDMEAKLLYDSGHQPVVWWRFFRMMLTKFTQRYIKEQMWRDGVVGLISSIYETFDTFIIYARLWELQQKS